MFITFRKYHLIPRRGGPRCPPLMLRVLPYNIGGGRGGVGVGGRGRGSGVKRVRALRLIEWTGAGN